VRRACRRGRANDSKSSASGAARQGAPPRGRSARQDWSAPRRPAARPWRAGPRARAPPPHRRPRPRAAEPPARELASCPPGTSAGLRSAPRMRQHAAPPIERLPTAHLPSWTPGATTVELLSASMPCRATNARSSASFQRCCSSRASGRRRVVRVRVMDGGQCSSPRRRSALDQRWCRASAARTRAGRNATSKRLASRTRGASRTRTASTGRSRCRCRAGRRE